MLVSQRSERMIAVLSRSLDYLYATLTSRRR